MTSALLRNSYTGLRSCVWSLALEEEKERRRNGEIRKHDNKQCSLVLARQKLCDVASRSNINHHNMHIGYTCYSKNILYIFRIRSKYFTNVRILSLLRLVSKLLNAVIDIVTSGNYIVVTCRN